MAKISSPTGWSSFIRTNFPESESADGCSLVEWNVQPRKANRVNLRIILSLFWCDCATSRLRARKGLSRGTYRGKTSTAPLLRSARFFRAPTLCKAVRAGVKESLGRVWKMQNERPDKSKSVDGDKHRAALFSHRNINCLKQPLLHICGLRPDDGATYDCLGDEICGLSRTGEQMFTINLK